MRDRAILLSATLGVAIAAVGACSSFESGTPVPDDDRRGAALGGPPPESDGSTADAEEGGLPANVTVLASGYEELSGVAATETSVYFTERGPGKIHSVPLTGGSAVELLSTGSSP